MYRINFSTSIEDTEPNDLDAVAEWLGAHAVDYEVREVSLTNRQLHLSFNYGGAFENAVTGGMELARYILVRWFGMDWFNDDSRISVHELD